MRRARIPADVEREDRLLAGLSARQVAILGGTALVLWAVYVGTRGHLPPIAFGALAAPIAGAAAAFALGRADGLSLDRLARAAFRQARAPRRLVQAPEGMPVAAGPVAAGPLARSRTGSRVGVLPALVRSVSPDGRLDLGTDGERVVCRASGVSFALRSDPEQEALLAAFGRFLNGLSAPAEIVVGAKRAALGPLAAAIEEGAPSLPDPGLEGAAREHAAFLRQLDESGGFYAGEVLLVASAPPGAGARDQLARQVDEATSTLAGAGVQVVALSGDEVTRTLALAADPTGPEAPAGSAAAGVVRRKR